MCSPLVASFILFFFMLKCHRKVALIGGFSQLFTQGNVSEELPRRDQCGGTLATNGLAKWFGEEQQILTVLFYSRERGLLRRIYYTGQENLCCQRQSVASSIFLFHLP